MCSDFLQSAEGARQQSVAGDKILAVALTMAICISGPRIEQAVGRLPGAFLACRHQVRVDPEREAGVSMAKVRRQRLDPLPRVEQGRGVEVAKRVHPGGPGWRDAGRHHGGTPTLVVEGAPVDRTPPGGGEQQRHRAIAVLRDAGLVATEHDRGTYASTSYWPDRKPEPQTRQREATADAELAELLNVQIGTALIVQESVTQAGKRGKTVIKEHRLRPV